MRPASSPVPWLLLALALALVAGRSTPGELEARRVWIVDAAGNTLGAEDDGAHVVLRDAHGAERLRISVMEHAEIRLEAPDGMVLHLTAEPGSAGVAASDSSFARG